MQNLLPDIPITAVFCQIAQNIYDNNTIYYGGRIVARMLARLAAALILLLGFGVFTAWAWDRSDHRQGLVNNPQNTLSATQNITASHTLDQ